MNIRESLRTSHHRLWKYVEETYKAPTMVSTASAEQKKATALEIANECKARTKLILLLNPINYVHVWNATTAAAVWKKLKTAFEDSRLTRRSAYCDN